MKLSNLFNRKPSVERLTKDDVARVYEALLHRQPEDPRLGVGQPPVDYILSVALSPERTGIVEREFSQSHMSTTGLALAKTDVGMLLTYVADKVIGESLRTQGTFEEAEIGGAIKLIKSLGKDTDLSTFVDVGANIGTHTLWAMKAGFRYSICVEADAANFKLLKINQILNDVDDRCRVVLAAASDIDGHLVLERSPSNFGDHRVASQIDAVDSIHGEESWQKTQIPSRRLDTIIEGHPGGLSEIGLVWIDTQGHEGHVLSGAPNLLASTIPIVAEFWPYGLMRSGGYHRLRSQLEQSGRRIYDLKASIQQGATVSLTIGELDSINERFLGSETKIQSPHTDLLLL